MSGGEIKSIENGVETILNPKHNADNDNNISRFLLDHSILSGKIIKTNQHGRKRSFSFRDLTRLILIDEASIIIEQSPIHSGRVVSKTAESSVFRLLLSSIDDSSIISQEDPKISKSIQKGKSEILDLLIFQANEQLKELGNNDDLETIEKMLSDNGQKYKKITEELSVEQEKVEVLENRRQECLSEYQKTESEVHVAEELYSRFTLLEKQYRSDLKRLESISEAGLRLNQMKEERCPICGALAEHHAHEHRDSDATLEQISNASKVEIQKIRVLIIDLKQTVKENNLKINELKESAAKFKADISKVEQEIQNELNPKIKVIIKELQNQQTEEDRFRQIITLYMRIQELNRLLEEAFQPNQSGQKEEIIDRSIHSETDRFCKKVEEILQAWGFPGGDRVTFSESDQDIIISGISRASHGKGVRALTHAAFNLALLKYCIEEGLSHPGFVIIDSPLVVYREPDKDEEGFSVDVKENFYRSLSKLFGDVQVIILENDDPPKDIFDSINYIKFTGTSSGRKGFIPEVGKRDNL